MPPRTTTRACISTCSTRTTKVGGWFRIGNRPNEGYAEISVCLYLPGGRVGFMFGRPEDRRQRRDERRRAEGRGGRAVQAPAPDLRRQGAACWRSPFEMADPSKAFRDNPSGRLQGRAGLRRRLADVRRRDGSRGRRADRDRSGEVVRQGPLRAAHGGEGALHGRRRDASRSRLRPARQELGAAPLAGDQLVSLVPDELRPRLRDDDFARRRRSRATPLRAAWC